METEILEEIKKSIWWKEAEKYPDRHHPKDSWVMLSDHLLITHENIKEIFSMKKWNIYDLLSGYELAIERLQLILKIVALLHDIGKPQDNKDIDYIHPLTQKLVKKRHNILWMEAAIQILWDSKKLTDLEKDIIYSLIDEHDTPFWWYINFSKTWQVPKLKSWKKLDNKIIWNDYAPLGIILLTIFKLADIDGHDDVSDVDWFIKNLNEFYLSTFNIKFFEPI